jgi:CubicO group peptidase (beta-lactamase class C family)
MNFQHLKDYLDYCLPMVGVPGSDTVICKGREVVFRHTTGYDSLRYRTPMRDNALYNLYSCTKVATCVAAVQLIERGEILATDPLYAYFPEYQHVGVKHIREDGTVDVRQAENPILIQHLLTMTAGMNYNLDVPAIQKVRMQTDGKCPTLDVIRALAEEPLDFEPGEKYQYSLCLDVIGGIVELVSGMKFSDYMRENIFLPLGMNRTTFTMNEDVKSSLATQYSLDEKNNCAVEIPCDDNPYRFGPEFESGGAGMISSVDDMILLADALTHFGVGKTGERILSKFGVNLMRSPMLKEKTFPIAGFGGHIAGYNYGYGVRVNQTPGLVGNLSPVGEFGWDGAKCSYISSDPESEISIFHAEHIGGMHKMFPRLRNLVYSCIGE